MENLWLIIMFIVLFRSLWRIMERSRERGKTYEPREGLPPIRTELSQGRAPGKEVEDRPKLNIPEYLKRRADGPATGATSPAGEERATTPSGDGREDRPQLNIPEYLKRRSPAPGAEAGAAGEGPKRRLPAGNCPPDAEKTVGETRPPTTRVREELPTAAIDPAGCPREAQGDPALRLRRRRRTQGGLLDDMICPEEVIKGLVWSQILGPRGGLQAKRAKMQKPFR